MNILNPLPPFVGHLMNSYPTVFVEGMSYDEVLYKIKGAVNQVIESQNSTIENVNELENDFKELKQFIEDYFNNLDVQDEINKKIDEMLKNGEFESIIAKYFTYSYLFSSFTGENDDDILDSIIATAESNGVPATIIFDKTATITRNHYFPCKIPYTLKSAKSPAISFDSGIASWPDEYFDILIGNNNVTALNFKIDKGTGLDNGNPYISIFIENLKVKSLSPNNCCLDDFRARDWTETYLFNATLCNVHCRNITVQGLGGLCDFQRDAKSSNDNYCDNCSFDTVYISFPQKIAIGSRSNDCGSYRNIWVLYPPKKNTTEALIELRNDRGSIIENIIFNGGYASDFDTEMRNQKCIRFSNCLSTLNNFEIERTLSDYCIEVASGSNVSINQVNIRLTEGGAVYVNNAYCVINNISIIRTDSTIGTSWTKNNNGYLTINGWIKNQNGTLPFQDGINGGCTLCEKTISCRCVVGTSNRMFVGSFNASTMFDSFTLSEKNITLTGWKTGKIINVNVYNRSTSIAVNYPVKTDASESGFVCTLKNAPVGDEYYTVDISFVPILNT